MPRPWIELAPLVHMREEEAGSSTGCEVRLSHSVSYWQAGLSEGSTRQGESMEPGETELEQQAQGTQLAAAQAEVIVPAGVGPWPGLPQMATETGLSSIDRAQ